MLIVVFFKQQSAYEMRISDWSSDVCSYDLCLAAAVALPCGAAAKAETLQLAPEPFKALPEGTAMVWENMDTGKKVQGVVGRTRGLIVTWIWDGRCFSSFAHVCMYCVPAAVPPAGGEIGELFPLQVGRPVRFNRTLEGEAWP